MPIRIKTDTQILAERKKRKKAVRRHNRAAKQLQTKAFSAAEDIITLPPEDWNFLITEPKPGLYRNVPYHVYEQIDALRQSKLQKIKRSPYHFRYDASEVSTKALRAGTLTHEAVLEPHELQRKYIALPDLTVSPTPILRDNGEPYDNPRQTKVYKQRVQEFREQHKNKDVIDVEEYNRLAHMAKAVTRSRTAKTILERAQREVTIIWIHGPTETLCKARVDILNEKQEKIGDIKTTASLAKFDFSLADFGYHNQAAFYRSGLFTLTGVLFKPYILAVESKPPYDSDCSPVHPEDVDIGAKENERMLKKLSECRSRGRWPGCRRRYFRLPKNYHPYQG